MTPTELIVYTLREAWAENDRLSPRPTEVEGMTS